MSSTKNTSVADYTGAAPWSPSAMWFYSRWHQEAESISLLLNSGTFLRFALAKKKKKKKYQKYVAELRWNSFSLDLQTPCLFLLFVQPLFRSAWGQDLPNLPEMGRWHEAQPSWSSTSRTLYQSDPSQSRCLTELWGDRKKSLLRDH